MASNIEQSAGDLFGAGEIPAERRFFSLAPGGMGAGMTIGDKYNHLLRLQKERAEVLSGMAGAQRSELDLMNTTQEITNLRNRHNVLDELDQLSFRDDKLPERLSQFDRAQLLDPVVARKVSNLAGKHANYQQGRTQIVQSLYDAGIPRGRYFEAENARATEMLNNYDSEGLAKFFGMANRAKAKMAGEREMQAFERKEEIKQKYSGFTDIDNLYTAHRKEVRTITKDAVPSYMVDLFPAQFIYGMPFPEKTRWKRDRDLREMSSEAFGGEGGPDYVEIDTEDILIKQHVFNGFDSFLGNLSEFIKEGNKPDKDGNYSIQTQVEKTDEDGNVVLKDDGEPEMIPGPIKKISKDELGGVRLGVRLEGADAEAIVDTFAREAGKRDLKSFIAWGTNENTGIKATLQKLAPEKGEAADPLWDIVMSLVGSVKDDIDPAKAFLADIHNFANSLKNFNILARGNFSGNRGEFLRRHVEANHFPTGTTRTERTKDLTDTDEVSDEDWEDLEGA